MRPIIISKTVNAPVTTAVCALQSPGAGVILINGTLASGGVATMTTQRQIIITSGGNDLAITFTITGTNDNGVVISETLTGTNGGTATSTLDYLTVTEITHTGSVATTITSGTNAVGCTHPIPLGHYQTPFNVSLALEFVTAGATATAQYTLDDVYNLAAVKAGTNSGGLRWASISSLTDKLADTDGSLTAPVSAVRMKITAGTTAATFIVRQSGYG